MVFTERRGNQQKRKKKGKETGGEKQSRDEGEFMSFLADFCEHCGFSVHISHYIVLHAIFLLFLAFIRWLDVSTLLFSDFL